MDFPDAAAAKCRAVLCVAAVVGSCLAAPLHPPPAGFVTSPRPLIDARSQGGSGRIFWSGLGDVLEALPFLPFTVNVPDALGAAWSYVSGWLPGTATGTTTGTTDTTGDKKPPRPKDAAAAVTGDDLVDYFLYDR